MTNGSQLLRAVRVGVMSRMPPPRPGLRRARGIIPRIPRRGIDSSERLGPYRWVVERSGAWLPGCRRPGFRYERRADLLHLARALICQKFLAPPTA